MTMILKKYKIHHLRIEEGIEAIGDDTSPGHYCVFWFKSIPLGHAYLTNEQASSQTLLYQKCINAISVSVNYYAALNAIDRLNITNTSFDNLLAYLDLVLNQTKISERCGDVSLIICTRNRLAHLKNCLYAFQNQIVKPSEIIVVDNGSKTRESKRVAAQFGVTYVREDRVGLDIARNTGIRSAKHSIVAFADDDVIPDPLWIYRITQTFSDKNVAAMTGLVLAGSLETEAEVIFERYWPFNRGYIPKTYNKIFFNSTLPGGPPVWEIGAGANMAFRRDVFDEVGYFDERLDAGAAGCSGDSEMWYRILANGFEIKYNPLAVVHHFHRASVPDLKRQIFNYMRGFTVAILIQYDRFGHKGNLAHLFKVLPLYYIKLIRKGFPFYNFQYQTLFSEIRGVMAGMLYFLRHRKTNSRIFLGP